VGKNGLTILSMDGGGMRGLATVQMLRRLEKGTGRRIHEIFDLICGTSTGGMLAVALGIKGMTLDECEEVYKSLGTPFNFCTTSTLYAISHVYMSEYGCSLKLLPPSVCIRLLFDLLR
jgi:patatin-like phospholipase/acyl hydrolase